MRAYCAGSAGGQVVSGAVDVSGEKAFQVDSRDRDRDSDSDMERKERRRERNQRVRAAALAHEGLQPPRAVASTFPRTSHLPSLAFSPSRLLTVSPSHLKRAHSRTRSATGTPTYLPTYLGTYPRSYIPST